MVGRRRGTLVARRAAVDDREDRTMKVQRVVALLAALVVSTACMGADESADADSPAGGEVEISEDALRVLGTDDLRFEPEELRAPAGDIEVALTCEDGINHNLVIIATGDEVAVCLPGETGVGSVTLEAGTYEFVCTIPGHSATMRGELAVG
jgi:plastocyanin